VEHRKNLSTGPTIWDYSSPLCGTNTIFPVEALNPPSGIHQLLFAGEEGMAIGAYLNLHIAGG